MVAKVVCAAISRFNNLCASSTTITNWRGSSLPCVLNALVLCSHAVLSGLAGREALRGMLARLQPKEEVLLLGWGVPMPLPVRSRRYDEAFWRELFGTSAGNHKRSKEQNLKELGF